MHRNLQDESGRIGDTYSFSPTLVMDLRVSYLRFRYDRTALTAGYDLTQLGWPASMNNQVVFRVVPQPNVTGYNGVWSTKEPAARSSPGMTSTPSCPA